MKLNSRRNSKNAFFWRHNSRRNEFLLNGISHANQSNDFQNSAINVICMTHYKLSDLKSNLSKVCQIRSRLQAKDVYNMEMQAVYNKCIMCSSKSFLQCFLWLISFNINLIFVNCTLCLNGIYFYFFLKCDHLHKLCFSLQGGPHQTVTTFNMLTRSTMRIFLKGQK